MNDNTPTVTNPKSNGQKWIIALIALVAGFLLCALVIVSVMPHKMIVTAECRYDFDETVDRLQEQIKAEDWIVVGGKPSSMNESLAKQGREFGPRVSLIKLCQPDYAKSVLTTDRHVACLMPCSIAIWEGDDGKTYLSKMNVGLMGKMFGGNVAKVMGGSVADDEKRILNGLVKL